MTQSRQKSYVENRKRDLEFMIGDLVYLNTQERGDGVGKKGKLSPPYVEPYEVLKHIRSVSYELKLPIELAPVLPVFHDQCSKSA